MQKFLTFSLSFCTFLHFERIWSEATLVFGFGILDLSRPVLSEVEGIWK
jgi:hypothetical protein